MKTKVLLLLSIGVVLTGCISPPRSSPEPQALPIQMAHTIPSPIPIAPTAVLSCVDNDLNESILFGRSCLHIAEERIGYIVSSADDIIVDNVTIAAPSIIIFERGIYSPDLAFNLRSDWYELNTFSLKDLSDNYLAEVLEIVQMKFCNHGWENNTLVHLAFFENSKFKNDGYYAINCPE